MRTRNRTAFDARIRAYVRLWGDVERLPCDQIGNNWHSVGVVPELYLGRAWHIMGQFCLPPKCDELDFMVPANRVASGKGRICLALLASL